MENWHNILISPNTSILQAIKIIDTEGTRAALVINESQKLLGMVTDGDIRRCLLNQISLEESVTKIMCANPTIAFSHENEEQILNKLKSLKLFCIPIMDEDFKVIGFKTLENFLSIDHKDNFAVIMAGGLGRRLRPLTEDCPKPLLKVGNKPVLEILLESLFKSGIRNFFFAINYKADMIKSYFQFGEKWNVNIQYIEEKQQLGTAGALSLLPIIPNKAFFVLNADVMTNINFQYLLDFHLESQVDATMCIREYEHIVPYGVVQRHEETHHLLNIIEKPSKQFFVSAGIYILEPTMLSFLTPNTYCDMPDLLTTCIRHQYRVATFPLREYWLDIGRHEDLEKAHQDFVKVF